MHYGSNNFSSTLIDKTAVHDFIYDFAVSVSIFMGSQ